MSWDSDEKRDANDKTNTSDVSKVYFLLSPEWKTASSEAQKVFLGVFLALYLVSLGLFCYILVEDSNMVHTLKLKAFMNHRPATPLLQKIQMEAKITFTTGSWYNLENVVLTPAMNAEGGRGTYPVVRETLANAGKLYSRCLTNYRTSPIIDIANVCLIVGSVVFVFAGPLVLLSRRAFYNYSGIGAILLGAWFLLIRAASGFVHDCLVKSQTVRIDDQGTLKDKLYNGTLFESIKQSELALTEHLGQYLAFIGFLPIVVMGCIAGKVLGNAA